jgi:hypothetical protein
MRKVILLIIGFGDFLMSLSDRSRLLIVVGALGLLGGGSIYKLTVSLQKLQEPLPVATPEQLIDPMQQLFRQTSTKAIQYKQARSRELQRLDSLAKKYSTIKPKD